MSISSTCAVFAESEVISRLANGERIEDIVAGIHTSVAKKSAGWPSAWATGPGVAMSGVWRETAASSGPWNGSWGVGSRFPRTCQLAGAIGAALFAYSDMEKL